MTIILIGAAAALSLTAWQRIGGDASDSRVTTIRRSTSVILAIADAVWAVLDALAFLTRRSGNGSTPLRRPGAIATASDVGE